MNLFKLLKKVARVFYYEGIDGIVRRIRKKLSKQEVRPFGDRAKRIGEIKSHLAGSQFVLLESTCSENRLQGGCEDIQKQSLLMFIPQPERGSGGRMTMARVLANLKSKGMRCYVSFYPEVCEDLFEFCKNEWLAEFGFSSEECKVIRLDEAKTMCFDIGVATYWPSAYVLKKNISALSKGYFVQDYEPYFYAPGSMAAFAEESYRLGLWGICASPWLAEKLSSEFGMRTTGFVLGLEKDEYYVIEGVKRQDNLVVAYIRSHTERRGYELIMWALKILKDKMPGIRIEIYGDASLPFDEFLWIDKNHGILKHGELCKLYNRASVGIVTSFTNYSLIPNEMMACGCAVVDLDTPCMRSVYPAETVSLSLATPKELARATEILLLEKDKRAAQVRSGLAYIDSISWSQSLSEIYSALQRYSSGNS